MPNLGRVGALAVDGGADLTAIGNAAVGSKRDTGGRQTLTAFSVKRGDNGGVLVCETYEKQPPAGRRVGASFPGGGDYKENPFSPTDGAGATRHITGLLQQMGVTAPVPATPAVGAAAGPYATAVGLRGPAGGAVGVRPRDEDFEY
jgi:hypothetical protein